MSGNKDWWPATKQEQLEMAKKWVQELKKSGKLWGIKPEIIAEFSRLTEQAEIALEEATNENTRTSVSMTKRDMVFDCIEKAARDMKKRFFYIPPLDESDIIALGLRLRDSILTASGTPSAQFSAETFLKGRHELGIQLVCVSGVSNDRANKSYRVYYKVLEDGEPQPSSPEELSKSFSIKKKKTVIRFDYEDSRKFACIAVQVENGDKKGPWGPMIKAVIP